ncbi:hypothetical protein CBF34_10655 [Vagococcus penaei]|uniref:class C sortase n=1 Tax=Vagococcus penaei TaxID=633807 RepID=UPI000F874C80|nr:class C sortase [Vagococcus penaei]RST98166.1 hypothetical protein CBF34_10655 [Vagococcus penaei]
MSKKFRNKFIIISLFLAGILLFTYPFYVNGINYLIDQKRMATYNEQQETKLAERRKKLVEKNNQIKVDGLVVDHDPFNDSQVNRTDGGKKLASHLIGAITIPTLDVTVPIYDTINNDILEEGAGVLPGTSLPVGGDSTHSVISAHRGLAERVLFRELDKLKTGDYFLIDVLGDTLAYQVNDVAVVLPEEIEVIKLQTGQDLVSLLTCTPYMINTHRLIVTGKRVPVTKELAKAKDTSEKNLKTKEVGLLLIIACVLALLSFLLIKTLFAWRLAKKKYDLVFYYVDKRNHGIEGVTFIIYPKRGKKLLKRNGQELLAISHKKGRVHFSALPGGSYRVAMKGAPNDILVFFTVKRSDKKRLVVKRSLSTQVVVKQKAKKIVLVAKD